MGFFGDMLKSGINAVKEQNEIFKSCYDDWDNSDVSMDFLISKLKKGALAEQMAAKKLLIDKYNCSMEEIEIFRKY